MKRHILLIQGHPDRDVTGTVRTFVIKNVEGGDPGRDFRRVANTRARGAAAH